jgi:hypothetical protein
VCGGTIRAEMSGSIEVPNHSTNGPITCVWKIISVGNLLSYYIDTLDMASDSNDNCTTNYVEVAEVFPMYGMSGPNAIVRSEKHKRYCASNLNETRGVTTITASDQLQVTLNSTRNIGRASQKYFKLFFRTIYQGRIIVYSNLYGKRKISLECKYATCVTRMICGLPTL